MTHPMWCIIAACILSATTHAIRVTTRRPYESFSNHSNNTNHTTSTPTISPTSGPTIETGCLRSLKEKWFLPRSIVWPGAKFTAPFDVSYCNKTNLIYVSGEYGVPVYSHPSASESTFSDDLSWPTEPLSSTSSPTSGPSSSPSILGPTTTPTTSAPSTTPTTSAPTHSPTKLEKVIRMSFILAYDPTTWTKLENATWNTTIRSPKKPILSSRPTTSIYADPDGSGVYAFGYKTMRKYDSSLNLVWKSDVQACSTASILDIKYDQATVNVKDANMVWVVGTCDTSKYIVLDGYSRKDGKLVHRETFLTADVFANDLVVKTIFINIGLIAPDISIGATPDGGFYIGVTHLLFNGFGFLERKSTTSKSQPFKFVWKFVPSLITASVLNPTLSGRKIIAVEGGSTEAVMLVEPQALLNWFGKNGRHYIARWGESGFGSGGDLWFGGHPKLDPPFNATFNIHLGWTLAPDVESKNVFAVTTNVPTSIASIFGGKTTTVAKYDMKTLNLIAGVRISGLAAASAVTRDGQVVVVGISVGFKGRKGFLQVVHADEKILPPGCNYCKPSWYKSGCTRKCACKHGGCLDGVGGDGSCLCNILSYNASAGCETCKCPLTGGLCDFGPTGSGNCTICFGDQKLNLLAKSSANHIPKVDFGVSEMLKMKIKWPNKYGPLCNKSCNCLASNGLCNPLANGDGQCLLCKRQTSYGRFCNMTCNCDEYSTCQKGVRGNGTCVPLDDGKSLTGIHVSGGAYAGIFIALFILFLATTWWNAQRKSLHGYLPTFPETWRNYSADQELLAG